MTIDPADVDVTPTFNRLAEMVFLGVVLGFPAQIPWASERIKVGHLYQPAHRLLWATIQDLHRRGKPINSNALKATLDEINRLEDCGGEGYPMALRDLADDVVGEHSIITACEQILDCSARREAMALGKTAENLSRVEILAKCQAIQDQSCDPVFPKTGVVGQFHRRDSRPCGCESGLTLIDSKTTTRGWPNAQMSVIGAYTGAGKTSLMLQSALAIAQRGERVIYASWADLDAGDIWQRLMKQLCGWSHRPERSDLAFDFEMADGLVHDMPIEIYDASSVRDGKDLESFIAWLTRYRASNEVSCVFLDYAQKLRSRESKGFSAVDKADKISDMTRWMAAESKLPIVVGSQITPGNPKAGTLDITKGSRAWEEDAGIFLKIKRFTDEERVKVSDYSGVVGLSSMELTKNRFGKSHVSTFQRWDEEKACFEDM